MRCVDHETEEVIGTCGKCARFVCPRDSQVLGDQLLCPRCLGEAGSIGGIARPRPRTKRGIPRREFRPFDSARAFARSLGLENVAAWLRFSRGAMPEKGTRPPDVPSNPQRTYRDSGWRGWIDFLGLPASRDGPYLPFEEARTFARTLGLRTHAQWVAYVRGQAGEKPPLPPNVPKAPHRHYAGQWQSWPDWLGKPGWRPFDDARRFVHALGLTSTPEWEAYCRGEYGDLPPLPEDIPRVPQPIYDGNGWQGIQDWLGVSEPEPCPVPERKLARIVAWIRSLPGSRAILSDVRNRYWLSSGEQRWLCEHLERTGWKVSRRVGERHRSTLIEAPGPVGS